MAGLVLAGGSASTAGNSLITVALARGGEGARIRRRYAPLLLRVHPIPAKPGQPLIDVATMGALATLAER